MLGSMMSLTGYMAVLGILVLWMVVKIWRSSPVLAAATFFVWPLSVISLVRNWGDSDTDIRIPFFLSLVTVGAIYWMGNRVVDKAFEEAGPAFTAQEIEAIRQENPQFAAELEARQLEASSRADALRAEQRSASRSAGALDQVRENDAGQSLAAGQLQSAERMAADAVQRRFQLRSASSALKFQRGSVRLDPARSTMAVPLHFRFVDANQLFRIARLRDTPLDGGSLGWVVHERVDLADPDAWFIDLRFEELGYLTVSQDSAGLDALQQQIALLGLSPAGVRFGTGNYAPQWDARASLATWMKSTAAVGGPSDRARVDLAAVRPLRHGVLVARITGLPVAQRELGLRTTRLIVSSTRPDAGWRHSDYRNGRDPAASSTLAEWVATY